MAYQFTLDETKPVQHITKTFGTIPRIPQYRMEDKSFGDWKLKTFKLGLAQGYWSTVSNQSEASGGNNIALIKNGETVMSVTPMECESHLIPCNNAKGNVVIAGLGLAMITINLLEKKAVKKITVLEIDDGIIDLYPDILAGKDHKLWCDNIASGRLQIIKQDCTKPISAEIKKKIGRTDYLWADTWNTLGCATSLPLTQMLQKEIKAKQVDFWGMEFVWIGDLVSEPLFKTNPLKAFRKWIDDTGLPLTALTYNGYKQRLSLDLSLIIGKLAIRSIKEQQNKSIFD